MRVAFEYPAQPRSVLVDVALTLYPVGEVVLVWFDEIGTHLFDKEVSLVNRISSALKIFLLVFGASPDYPYGKPATALSTP
jgi:hypothetical protein